MTCTGSLFQKEVFNNIGDIGYKYSLIFNKDINYCQEILESFNILNDGMISNWCIDDDGKNLIINIFHETSVATKETDLFFVFLTSIYYDCNVIGNVKDKNPYNIRIIDGQIIKS